MTYCNSSISYPAKFSTRRFGRRELIPTEPAHAWQITTGYVRSFTLEPHDAVVSLGLWRTGDIIARFVNTIQPYYLECLTPVEVVPVHMANIKVEELLATHLQQAQQLVRILHQTRIETRLTLFLYWLAEQVGVSATQGILLDMPLTHQDIADALGTTRVTITRLIKQFQRQGMILHCRRRYILCDTPLPIQAHPSVMHLSRS
ncbi:MAG: Crp/Fnr family transcriptional regulator [Kaiparowitsia implicata GSE-PSE-MK54-09C]|jgi:CRP-like cAMP-binding protein|nr:Crp/Fnr family transcriptional regulator [Kaiparowitsia implicata GSE-PSE-MK54-09C]